MASASAGLGSPWTAGPRKGERRGLAARGSGASPGWIAVTAPGGPGPSRRVPLDVDPAERRPAAQETISRWTGNRVSPGIKGRALLT